MCPFTENNLNEQVTKKSHMVGFLFPPPPLWTINDLEYFDTENAIK